MSIAQKLTTIAENMQAVYEAGKKSEYDTFWDSYQDNGARASYSRAFMERGWNNVTFKPKYDIIPTGNAISIFQYCAVRGDLAELLENQNVILDFSQVTTLTQGFLGCSLMTRIGIINLSNITANANSLFEGCKNLETIYKLIMPTANISVYTAWFANCNALKNIVIEGDILTNIDFHWSTGLTKASLDSIISHLSDTASGKTITLPSTASANYGSGWDALIATKPNWTFAYL